MSLLSHPPKRTSRRRQEVYKKSRGKMSKDLMLFLFFSSLLPREQDEFPFSGSPESSFLLNFFLTITISSSLPFLHLLLPHPASFSSFPASLLSFVNPSSLERKCLWQASLPLQSFCFLRKNQRDQGKR